MPETQTTVADYSGTFRHGVDGSRRVMIPAKWRPKDPKFVFRVILWPIAVEECLLVLPPDPWQQMLQKVKTGKLHDPRAARLERVLGATSTQLLLDKVGRFCLPEALAAKVGIEQEAAFVGRLDKFEIWAPGRHEAINDQDKQTAAAMLQELGI